MTLAKRCFARMVKMGDSINHKMYGPFKRELVGDAKGLIVEIGPGTGVNLSYLPRGIEWIGIEPDEAFDETLLAKARAKWIDARLLLGNATKIPLQDESDDVALCRLVLCSIEIQANAIPEMKRVFKPSGKFIFIEHLAAPQKSTLRWAQECLNPVNRAIADGCACKRETWTSIQHRGSDHVDLSYFKMNGALPLHAPHVMGFATQQYFAVRKVDRFDLIAVVPISDNRTAVATPNTTRNIQHTTQYA